MDDAAHRNGRTEGKVPALRPLTRRNGKGELYARTDRVERQIGEALAMPPKVLVERARIRDHRDSGHLQEEGLVYLIREFHGRGDHAVVDDLCAILLERIDAIAGARLQSLGTERAEEAIADMASELFPKIVDLDSGEADFYQVRFRTAIERMATSAFRHWVQDAKRAALTVSTSALAGHDTDSSADDEYRVGGIMLADQPAPDDAVEDTVISRDEFEAMRGGLALLSDEARIAFILRHRNQWPIQHRDPSIPTISAYFRRDPRTIRNWLREARQTLDAWLGART